MNLDNKEKRFKKILETPSQAVDIDALWSSIEPDLPKKEDNNKGIIWWLSATFLLSVTLITVSQLFQIAGNNKGDKTLHKASIKKQEIAIVDKPIVKTDKDIEVEDKSITDASKPINTESIKIKTNRNLKTSFTQIQGTAHVPPIKTKNNVSTLPQNTDKSKDLAGTKMDADAAIQYDKTNFQNEGLIETEHLNIHITAIAGLQNTLAYNYTEDLLSPSKIYPVKEKNRYRISLLQGINRGNSYIIGLRENDGKAASINRREKDMIGYAGGIEFSQYLKPRWRISLGINYNLQVTRYRQLDVQSSETYEEGLKEYVIDANGATNPVLGEVGISTTTYSDITWHRKDHQVDLMVATGFQLLKKSSFSIWIDGGAAYNVWNHTSGYDYGGFDILGFRKLEGQESQEHLGNKGFKTILAPSISYKYRSWEYNLRYNYTKFYFSPERENSIYTIKNSQTGIQLGICYHLNGN